MPGLLHDDSGDVARCALCGRAASGPCASCRKLVCADCCVLTSGGAGTFAVCRRCEARGHGRFRHPYLGLIAWLAGLMLALAAIAGAIYLLRR